jgi:tRNA pseudouridine38-40 synthase
MKYFLHIGYSGSDYSGWQWQPNVESIQGTIEEKLKAIFKEEIKTVGCGRTDAGVHASQYILHIVLKNELDFDLKFRINKHLPRDITVYDVIKVKEKQHARFDAKARTYDYFIHLYNDPILGKYSSFYELENLDFKAMQKAASLLPSFSDFKMVCKQPDIYDHTICNVTYAHLFINRFLRGMIRLIIFFLLEVGQGKMSLEQFQNIFSGEEEFKDKIPAYAQGLYLSKIEYPYLELKESHNMCNFLKIGLED